VLLDTDEAVVVADWVLLLAGGVVDDSSMAGGGRLHATLGMYKEQRVIFVLYDVIQEQKIFLVPISMIPIPFHILML
jgi:hypothetical protein